MTWFVVDDGFWGHPKVTDLSGEAIALWVQAGSWCCRYLTDGKMPLDIARKLGRKQRAVDELLTANLWETDHESLVFHDWSDYQDTRENILARRKQAAERKQKSRMSRDPDAVSHAGVTAESRVAPVLSSPFLSSPLPSQPLPEREEKSTPIVVLPVEPSAATGKRRKPAALVKSPAPTADLWEAYSEAYQARYDVPPVRNATVNGQLARVLGRLGGEEAPEVARWYLRSQNARYVASGHPVGLLLQDAEKLRTEWATGRQATAYAARVADKQSGRLAEYEDLFAEMRALDAAREAQS